MVDRYQLFADQVEVGLETRLVSLVQAVLLLGLGGVQIGLLALVARDLLLRQHFHGLW